MCVCVRYNASLFVPIKMFSEARLLGASQCVVCFIPNHVDILVSPSLLIRATLWTFVAGFSKGASVVCNPNQCSPFEIRDPSLMGTGISRPMMGTGISRPMMGTGISRPLMRTGISRPLTGTGISRPSLMGTGISRPSLMGTGISRPSLMGTGISRPSFDGHWYQQTFFDGHWLSADLWWELVSADLL